MALSTSRKRLHIRAVKKELLRVLLFHEPRSFRHLHTIRFPQGEGVRQRFAIKLTMPRGQATRDHGDRPLHHGQCLSHAHAPCTVSRVGSAPATNGGDILRSIDWPSGLSGLAIESILDRWQRPRREQCSRQLGCLSGSRVWKRDTLK